MYGYCKSTERTLQPAVVGGGAVGPWLLLLNFRWLMESGRGRTAAVSFVPTAVPFRLLPKGTDSPGQTWWNSSKIDMNVGKRDGGQLSLKKLYALSELCRHHCDNHTWQDKIYHWLMVSGFRLSWQEGTVDWTVHGGRHMCRRVFTSQRIMKQKVHPNHSQAIIFSGPP